MKFILNTLLFVALALGGCASLPGDPSKMTPEQLKANAKDRNSTAACSNGKTAAGNVTLIYVNADQGTRLGSTVNIKADCETTITTLYTAADIAAAVKAAEKAATAASAP